MTVSVQLPWMTTDFSPQFQYVIQEACDNRKRRQLEAVFPDLRPNFSNQFTNTHKVEIEGNYLTYQIKQVYELTNFVWVIQVFESFLLYLLKVNIKIGIETLASTLKICFSLFIYWFVLFQVTDEDGQPLSAVLLSLSAGQFRSNNLTLENGSMVFANLVSTVSDANFPM